MVAFTVLFVAALLGMSADKVQDEISVKHLRIVDERGQTVTEMTASKLGGRIVVRSADGVDTLLLESDAKGGSVSTFKNNGRRAIVIGTYQVNSTKQAGIVNVFDWDGHASVSLGTGVRGEGAVSMGAHCPGGVLVVDQHGGDMMRVDLCLLRELSESLGRK